MLSYSEIKPGVFIVHNGQPYEVLSSKITRKQQRKPTNVVKMRNLTSNKVVEKSFGSNESTEEAELETREIKYLYHDTRKGEHLFSHPDDPKDRFSIPNEVLGEKIQYVKENSIIESLEFNNKTIGIKIPIKVELCVTEAPPNVKGNTAQGSTKPVVLETGATVNAPMFISEGDTIRLNTETGEYTERV